MTRFSAATRADAVVAAPRAAVWAALTDPDVVAQLTPFVRRITVVEQRAEAGAAAAGEASTSQHWRWEMAGLTVLGIGLAPTFTERMTYDEPSRIDFRHDPPAHGSERSAVEGWYALTEVDTGTRLTTSMEITVDLPLPRISSGPVRLAMCRVIDQMGDRFSRNLLAHLDTHQVD